MSQINHLLKNFLIKIFWIFVIDFFLIYFRISYKKIALRPGGLLLLFRTFCQWDSVITTLKWFASLTISPLFKSFSFFNKTLFQNDTKFYSTISGLLGIEHHKNHFSTLFQQKTKLTIFIKLTCIFVIPIISIYRTRFMNNISFHASHEKSVIEIIEKTHKWKSLYYFYL